MDNYINSDLIRGNIDTIILRSLVESDKYGYEILKEIEAKSQGEYILKQPTLYSCLKRLESQGYITSFWGQITLGGRRKYYKLTPKGQEYFEKIQADWEYSRTLIDKLIAKRKASAQINSENQEQQAFNSQLNQIDEKDGTNLSSKPHFQEQKESDKTISSNVNNYNQDICLSTTSLDKIDTKILEKNEKELTKKEQIFIFGKIDNIEEKKETTKEIDNSEKVVPLYTPIKGSPIYAKSDRALSPESTYTSEPILDNPRSFIKQDEFNHQDNIKKANNTFSKPILHDEPVHDGRFDIKPLNEEKIKAKIDDKLIGKTKINFNTDEVFFANQKKSANSEPLKTYGDLMLQEKMELFRNNISQKTNQNKTYSSSIDNQLYSIPDNQSPSFNDNITSNLGRTYESIEEAQQEYTLEKEYKNVLGKLFDEKSHNYEIKRADHNIQKIENIKSVEQTSFSSYDLNNIRVVPFSKEVASEYYRTYYVFYNKFKLAQYLIFSLLLFITNIALYFLLNIAFKFDFYTGYYFVGGLTSILIALIASLAFFYKPNRRKKIYFDFKREIIKKFYLFLISSAVSILILFIADKNLFLSIIHFSKALITIILLINVLSLPLIAQIMFTARTFSIKA